MYQPMKKYDGTECNLVLYYLVQTWLDTELVQSVNNIFFHLPST